MTARKQWVVVMPFCETGWWDDGPSGAVGPFSSECEAWAYVAARERHNGRNFGQVVELSGTGE